MLHICSMRLSKKALSLKLFLLRLTVCLFACFLCVFQSMSDLGDKAIKSTMTLSGPSGSVSTTSPVTPPLTPLLDEAATAESITLAGASAQPTSMYSS